MITQKSIQEVIQTAKIEEVVGDFVNLRRRGVNLIGLCPFHDEKTPSFTVSPSKNICKCFGCGKGGDPVRFIMEHEKISFPEAIRYLAQRYRIELEETENTEEEKQQKELNDSLYIINEFARDYFVDVLFNRSEGQNIGLSYFKERGYADATIKKFELGYTTEERDDLTQKANNRKFNPEHLKLLGLTSQSGYDFFRSRVMFTIHNLSGKVIAFAGRTLSADKKVPKYINSPESEIYNKRNILYGLYFAKDAIRKNDECIMVEGYTDVITLHQGGIENVVASSGTSLTKAQIKLIQRFTPNIKIIYDGDLAGINAALRGLDLVLEANMNVKLVLLPDGQDPDSFLAANGSQYFSDYLKDHEEDFVLFKARILLQESGGDPIKKAQSIKDIVSSVAKIPDSFKRSTYLKECSKILDISEEILISETRKLVRLNIKAEQEQPNESQQNTKKENEWLSPKPQKYNPDNDIVTNDTWQERDVCRIAVHYGHEIYDEDSKISIAQFIVDEVTEFLEYFDIPLYKKIIHLMSELLSHQTVLNHSLFTGHEDEDVREFAITVLSTPYVYASWDSKEMFLQTQKMPDENYVADANNAVLRLKLKKSKRIIKQLEEWLASADEATKESEEYEINIKVLQVVMIERNNLAEKLRTVTLQ